MGPTTQAPQLGATNLVDPIVGRTLNNACLAGGEVWFCATRGQPGGPAIAAYYRIYLDLWPGTGSPILQEEGTVGAPTDWNYCPAIGVNLAGDAAITWTRSSSTRYTAMMCAWHPAGTSAFAAPVLVRASNTANTDGRWGDYFSTWPDPNDGSLWCVSEWTRTDTGTWSTWCAQVAMPPREFYVNWNGNPGVQDGSLAFPFVRIGLAHEHITSGTLQIFGGNYNEQLTLNKAVTLNAYSGGPVTIGAP